MTDQDATFTEGDCGDCCECEPCQEREERASTPGTAEYIARVEAEGQKRLPDLSDLPEYVP